MSKKANEGNVVRLRKLTEYNINELKNKNICCYERSISYLIELCHKYELLERIEFVVDDSFRNQGNYLLFKKNIPVFNLSCLTDIDWNNYAIVITSDYYREAFEKLQKVECIAEKLDSIYYFTNQETEFDDFYRHLYKDCTLENTIVFRSGPHASAYIKGMDFSDNARALFEHMLSYSYNDKYKLVWLVKEPRDFDRYKCYKNVFFLSFDWSISKNKEERDVYYRAICLAKYIFFTDAYGFARNSRGDQIRVQLWHGCGFKTRVNFVRCEQRFEYMTVTSDLYAKIHEDIYGLRKEQLLVTGNAKQDWLFYPYDKDYRELLGTPKADKYIFWLPTFRTAEAGLRHLSEGVLNSDTGLPIVNTEEKMESLNKLLIQSDIVLIIKPHPFQRSSSIHYNECSNIVLINNQLLFDQDIQLNRLLAKSDALISDYSSVAIDYMLLNKPMAFLLEDLDDYAQSRGFVFGNIRDWLPGKQVSTFDEMCDFIRGISTNDDLLSEKRLKLMDKMNKYHDNNSCARIIKELGI